MSPPTLLGETFRDFLEAVSLLTRQLKHKHLQPGVDRQRELSSVFLTPSPVPGPEAKVARLSPSGDSARPLTGSAASSSLDPD